MSVGEPQVRLEPPNEHRVGPRLENLSPGARVSGVAGMVAVDVLTVVWRGANAITLTYRGDLGTTGQQLLYHDHEPSRRVLTATRAQPFAGDTALFRLALEALRLRMATRFDPILAAARCA